MSWPAEKLGPAPVRMTTRMASSASAAAKAAPSSTSRPRFCALRASGRFSVMRTTRPSSSVSTCTNSYSLLIVGPPRLRDRVRSVRRARAPELRPARVDTRQAGASPGRVPAVEVDRLRPLGQVGGVPVVLAPPLEEPLVADAAVLVVVADRRGHPTGVHLMLGAAVD